MPIVGVIENMKGFVCPKCTTKSEIFPATTGGAAAMCKEMNVNMLAELPLDPQISRACDQGTNFIEEFADSDVTKALNQAIDGIMKFFET